MEVAQEFNEEIEPFMDMAQRNEPLEQEDLPEVTPAFP